MKKLIYLILIIGICSCGSKKSILNENFETNSVSIEGIVNSIEIIDNRKARTIRPLYIPKISVPNQNDKVSPVLNEIQLDSIEKQIKSYFSNRERNINVVFEILKGDKEFSAGLIKEREFVRFDSKIELLELSNNKNIGRCSSTASFEVKSLDASNKFIDKLFNKAIRVSIYRCFKEISEKQ